MADGEKSAFRFAGRDKNPHDFSEWTPENSEAKTKHLEVKYESFC
jgi:hypothetical protein